MRRNAALTAGFCCALVFLAVSAAFAAPAAPVDGSTLVAQKKAKAPKAQPKKDQDKQKGKTEEAKTPAEGSEAGAPVQGTEGGPMLQRSNRLEFDARLILGQLAKTGAIYLFDRAPRQLPPLLKLKRSYLRDIVDSELGADYSPPQK